MPGHRPHPTRDPAGHSYGKREPVSLRPPEQWRADEAYLRGIDLYHAGYFWEAHEAWEGIWALSRDPVQRAFLQALIQLAASLLKRSMGRERAAEELRRRALSNLAEVPSPYMGLDLAPLRSDLAPRLALDSTESKPHRADDR